MAKGRNSRDPLAPKRNLSAYLLYQNAMRNTFKADNPGMTFGELSKYTSAMYAQLTTQQKAQWQERAEADKQRFLHEMSTYTAAPGFDANGNAIAQYPHVTGSRKKQRDPLAPKRSLSAYLLYQNAMREQFKADNPGMTFGQLSKYTSHMYKSLTPEEKAQWEERALRDKERYAEEMKHYIPPHGFDGQGNLMAEFAVPRKNSRRNPKDPNMPKRARGSFVLFTKDERPKIQKENPSIKFTDLGAVLGVRWRNLSAEERKKYDDLADQDKIRFANEMEVYKQQVNQTEQFRLQQERQAEAYYTQEAQAKHQQHEIYQQDSIKYEDQQNQQQYFIQDQQQQLYHQQAVALQLQQDQQQIYHSNSGQLVHNDMVYKTEEVHDPQAYEQLPSGQVYESDIYKTDHDVHPSTYYAPWMWISIENWTSWG